MGSHSLTSNLLGVSSKLKGSRNNLAVTLKTFGTSPIMANEEDRSNMGGQMKSRAEASMRRIVDRVTKEAKARMERKPSGEEKGMSKGGKEDLLHPYTAKKSSGGMSDL